MCKDFCIFFTYDSKPDFEAYGLGCFRLAGSEVWKMAK